MKRLFNVWNTFLKEEEQEQKIITFDFDDTLSLSHWGEEEDTWVHDGPHQQMVNRIKNFIADPSITVYIVTSRFEKHEPQSLENPNQQAVQQFLDDHKINVDGVFFTNGQSKIETLLKLQSTMHHDDDPGDILDAKEHAIETIVSDPYNDYASLEASELKSRKLKEKD